MKEKEIPEMEEENYNDMYDIARTVIKVHSKHEVLNEDFTLANLNSEILTNNLIIYIKENINIMVAINNYLSVKGDEEYKTMTNQLLLDEVITLTNLSRADASKVLDAILYYIKSQGNQPQIPSNEPTTEKKGILQKINPFAKKSKEE